MVRHPHLWLGLILDFREGRVKKRIHVSSSVPRDLSPRFHARTLGGPTATRVGTLGWDQVRHALGDRKRKTRWPSHRDAEMC